MRAAHGRRLCNALGSALAFHLGRFCAEAWRNERSIIFWGAMLHSGSEFEPFVCVNGEGDSAIFFFRASVCRPTWGRKMSRFELFFCRFWVTFWRGYPLLASLGPENEGQRAPGGPTLDFHRFVDEFGLHFGCRFGVCFGTFRDFLALFLSRLPEVISSL